MARKAKQCNCEICSTAVCGCGKCEHNSTLGTCDVECIGICHDCFKANRVPDCSKLDLYHFGPPETEEMGLELARDRMHLTTLKINELQRMMGILNPDRPAGLGAVKYIRLVIAARRVEAEHTATSEPDTPA